MKNFFLVLTLLNYSLFCEEVDSLNADLAKNKIIKLFNLENTSDNPEKKYNNLKLFYYLEKGRKVAFASLSNNCDKETKLDERNVVFAAFEHKNKNKWKLKAIYPKITSNRSIYCGSYCAECNLKLTEIGKENYALELNRFSIGGGPGAWEFNELFLLHYKNGFINKILNLETRFEDMMGNPEEFENYTLSNAYQSKLEFLKNNNEYYDISVSTKGLDFFLTDKFAGSITKIKSNDYFRMYDNYINDNIIHRIYDSNDLYKFNYDKYSLVETTKKLQNVIPLNKDLFENNMKDKFFKVYIDQSNKETFQKGIYSDIKLKPKKFKIKILLKEHKNIKIFSYINNNLFRMMIRNNQDLTLTKFFQRKVEEWKSNSTNLPLSNLLGLQVKSDSENMKNEISLEREIESITFSDYIANFLLKANNSAKVNLVDMKDKYDFSLVFLLEDSNGKPLQYKIVEFDFD